MRTQRKKTGGTLLLACGVFLSLVPGAMAATVRLTVPDLACAQGSDAVQGTLTALPGVLLVDDDIIEHKVTVTFDQEKTSVTAIREALGKAKYPTAGAAEMLGR